MACSLKSVIACGIVLSVFDILHGLTSLAFYGNGFINYYFFLCPIDLPLPDCYNKRYFYERVLILRIYVGLGEGVVTLIFAIMLIIALVKRYPCLSWMWIFKCVAVMGANVYFISNWMIRQEGLKQIALQIEDFHEYQKRYVLAGAGFALTQLAFMIAFCIINSIFTYKVGQERRRSQRSLRNLHPRSNKYRNGSPSAPALDGYNDNGSYLNQALADSTNKIPLETSSSSIDKTEYKADTYTPDSVDP